MPRSWCRPYLRHRGKIPRGINTVFLYCEGHFKRHESHGADRFKEGIRPLIEEREITDVYELLDDHDVELDTSTWNRRYRDYMNKIKTGSLLEIALLF